MKAKVFSSEVKGVFTHIKAYKKVNAVAIFKQLDNSIESKDVKVAPYKESGQAIVEEEYPEICVK